ncbi:MAG: hypothetical protein SPI63_07965 [Bulleidia sp.]|nr:hypothetical protein [Bulleidia sp.]
MIKKYYQSLNSLQYGPIMTPIVFLIFACAFLYERKGIAWLRVVMIIATVLLAILLFLYYTTKLRISRTLIQIKNINDYEKGGVVDRSWILENRMIACTGLNIQEESTTNITKMKVEEGRYGKLIIHLTNSQKTFQFSCRDKSEARRFAGYLQKRNPTIQLENITVEGNGTLQDLGAA